MSSEAAYFPDSISRAAESAKKLGDDAGSQAPRFAEGKSGSATDDSSASDEYLLNRVRHEDRDALDHLFRRYARLVRSVGRRILHNEAEADDLVQEVFLYLFRKANLFDSAKGTALTWILHVSYHRAFDRRRYLIARKFYASQGIEEHLERLPDPRKEVPFDTQSWDGVLGRKLAERFRTRLTSEQQETLQLFFFEGYALKEIAELTGRSLVNVRSHYYRGLERLRQFAFPETKRSK